MLEIFTHNNNRTNYAKEAVLLLYQYCYVLSPQEKEKFLYNRFINTSGYPGRNISADLHMEHLNRQVKDGISGMGAGKSEDSIVRYSKAIGTIGPILEKFDADNNIKDHKSCHKPLDMEKDMTKLLKHINNCEVFSYHPGRKYDAFPNPKCLLHKETEQELIQWMQRHF